MRNVAQVGKVAPQLLRIVAGEQGGPGRQATGVLRAQLPGELFAALGQHGLLRRHLALQAGQIRFGLLALHGQFGQPPVDLRDGGFGLAQGIGGFLARRLAFIDGFLQRLDTLAQRRLLALRLGLLFGEIRRRRACRRRRPAPASARPPFPLAASRIDQAFFALPCAGHGRHGGLDFGGIAQVVVAQRA